VKSDPAHASAEWSPQKCGISILAERFSGKPQFHFELYF